MFLNSPFAAHVYIKITEHYERKKFMTRKLNRIREGTRSNWMISECLDSNNTTRDRKLQKNNEAVSLELLGSLSKSVFERRTLTGSAFFSPLICLDAITFVLLSVFIPAQITCPKSKGIQDSLIFWIPDFRSVEFQSLVGFRIPCVVFRIQDSGFHKQNFPGFRIP